MDIERAFKFVFSERNWFGKIVIGGVMILFAFLIVPIFIYYGYLVEVARRVINQSEEILPEWDNIGRKIADGFKLVIIFIVYFLPALVLFTIPAMFGEYAPKEEFPTAFLSFKEFDFEVTFTGISLLFALTGLIYTLFVVLISPFIVGKFAETGVMGDAFQISEIVGMFRENIGDAVIVLLLSVAVQFVASLGMALCFIGVFLTGFWAYTVQYFLYGELYRIARDKVRARGYGFTQS